ncbi:MAG: DMT family transporter [Scytonema sp. PMC 1069.18]|nr:DMT family transporter [Scytonema sp. PMC 1069.18]MEC4886626.1 DMT family transporter [Scytonema sp. PMC 1070.18]
MTVTQLVYRQSLSKTAKAIIASFVAMLILCVVPILVRWSENEISPNAVMFNRGWIAAMIFLLWQELSLLHQRRSGEQLLIEHSLDKKQILLLIASGVFSCMTQLLWAWSLTQTSVTNSSLIHSLTPFFTAFGGYLFLKQRFDHKFLVGLAIATLGTITLGLVDLEVASVKLQGDLLAFLSALFFGLYLLTVEKLRTQLAAITILTWICRIVSVLFALILFTTQEEWFPHSWNGWLAVITLALTFNLGNGLLTYSLKHLSSSFIAMIYLLEPVVTAFLSWVILAEAMSRSNMIAFAIVILGIYLALNSTLGQTSTDH